MCLFSFNKSHAERNRWPRRKLGTHHRDRSSLEYGRFEYLSPGENLLALPEAFVGVVVPCVKIRYLEFSVGRTVGESKVPAGPKVALHFRYGRGHYEWGARALDVRASAADQERAVDA
ncbi:hypothetical protein R1flu_005926 [Riccia fluitans]|uniref:Uncharacterized protein n=1 Tax=Riccia fluitans TaxID=41844 RepID=A0ABD1YYJ8_9MARC